MDSVELEPNLEHPQDERPFREVGIAATNNSTKTDPAGLRGIERQSGMVFNDEFVMDSVGIEQKDLMAYINGKAMPLLGDDFYYSYYYSDGILSFIALKSKQYVVGKLPLFYPALMLQGNFVYKKPDAEYFYYITNKDGLCSTEVGYDQRQGYLPIGQVPVAKIPATMKLKWSLGKKTLFINAFMGAIFVMAVLFFIISSKNYDSARAEQQRQAAQLAPVIPRGLPSFINSVAELGKKIEGKGYIEKVSLVKDQLSSTIKFKQDADAQVFLKNSGGKYEGDKVIYTTALSAAR